MSIEKKPLVNDLYTADPSAHVFNGKIYIYPSHDEDIDVESNDNGDQYDMKDYHVYEMKDTETYPRDCGCVFTLDDVKWASKQLWAPDCEEKDGKYYFYFPARDKNGMFRVGVAVGDKPEGPFTPEDDYIQGTYSIDPCCFKDTDGKYYLTMGGLWGGQLDQYRNNKWSADNKEPQGEEPACTPKIALLKDNMLYIVSITLQTTSTTRPIHFKEQVEMTRLRIQYMVHKNVNKITHRSLNRHDSLIGYRNTHRKHCSDGWHIVARLVCAQLFQTPEKVGVRLYNVQMGVLRLGVVSIQF